MAKGKRPANSHKMTTRSQQLLETTHDRSDDRDEGGGPSGPHRRDRDSNIPDADSNVRISRTRSGELQYGPPLPSTAQLLPDTGRRNQNLGRQPQIEPDGSYAEGDNPWVRQAPDNGWDFTIPGQRDAELRSATRKRGEPSRLSQQKELTSERTRDSVSPSSSEGRNPRNNKTPRGFKPRNEASGRRSTVSAERQMADEEAVIEQLELMDQGVREALDAGRNAARVARDTILAAERIALQSAAARQRILFHLRRRTGPAGPRPDSDGVDPDPRAQALVQSARDLVDEAEERRRLTAEYVRRQRADVLTRSEQDQINNLVDREERPRTGQTMSDRQERVDGRERHPIARVITRRARGSAEPPDDDSSSSSSSEDGNSNRPQFNESYPSGGRRLGEGEISLPRYRETATPGRGPRDRIEQLLSRAFRPATAAMEGPQLTKLGIKVPLPDSYDGTSDLELFENWLAQLLGWFQMYNLDVDSPEIDRVRLQILRQQLKGRASSYFQQRSEESVNDRRPWTFVIAIRKIRDRFLYKSTALDAAFKFENLTQGSRDVETLADDLKRYAERMTEPPAPYQVRRRLMQALKSDIAKWLISNQVTPESHSLDGIVAAAKAVEESERYNRGFQAQRVAPATQSNIYPSRDNKGKAPMRPFRPIVGSSHPPQGGASANHRNGGSGARPAQHQAKPGTTGPRPTFGGNVPPVKEPKTPDPTYKRGGQVPPQQPRGSCYVCGSKDHWASYHTKQNPRGFAARVIDEDDHPEKDDQDVNVPQGDRSSENAEETTLAEKPEVVQEDYLEEPEFDELEGAQYDPDEYPEQYRWSDIEDDAQGYGARLVPIEDLEEIRGTSLIQGMAAKVTPSKENPLLNSQARRNIVRVAPQPKRDPKTQRTINVLLNIGGVKADVLVDTGSTTNMMTPNFARVADTKAVELQTQMGLRLAVKGSGSKLNYGAWGRVIADHIDVEEYFDIVNLDRHDVVLGTPFLWTQEVSPIFEEDGYLQCKGRRLDIPILPCWSEANSTLEDRSSGPSFLKS
jgi:hypothetical protein